MPPESSRTVGWDVEHLVNSCYPFSDHSCSAKAILLSVWYHKRTIRIRPEARLHLNISGNEVVSFGRQDRRTLQSSIS